MIQNVFESPDLVLPVLSFKPVQQLVVGEDLFHLVGRMSGSKTNILWVSISLTIELIDCFNNLQTMLGPIFFRCRYIGTSYKFVRVECSEWSILGVDSGLLGSRLGVTLGGRFTISRGIII